MSKLIDLSAEDFRAGLSDDCVQLVDIKKSLISSSESYVQTQTAINIREIHSRWSKLVSYIREPELGSTSAAIHYVDYLAGEMRKYATKEVDAFNRAYVALLAACGPSQTGVSDLIEKGSASADSGTRASADRLSRIVEKWTSSFPYIMEEGASASIDKFESLMQTWRTESMNALSILKPSAKLVDPAYRELDGNSAGVFEMTEPIVSPDNLYPAPLTAGFGASGGAKGVSGIGLRLAFVVKTDGTGGAAAGSINTDFCYINGGGMILSFRARQPSAKGVTGWISTRDTDGWSTLFYRDWPTSTFTITCTEVNNAVPRITTTIGVNGNCEFAVPYVQAGRFLLTVATNFSVPNTVVAPNDLYEIDVKCTKVTFNTVRAMIGSGTAGRFDAMPTVIDAIGEVVSPVTTCVFSENVSRLWQLLRAYEFYLRNNGSVGILDVLGSIFKNLNITYPANEIDERMLDIDWWLQSSATLSSMQKKRVYRQFFDVIGDFVVIATTDSGFRNHLSSDW